MVSPTKDSLLRLLPSANGRQLCAGPCWGLGILTSNHPTYTSTTILFINICWLCSKCFIMCIYINHLFTKSYMFVLTRPPLSHAHRPCQDLDLFECFSGKSRLSAAFGQAPRCWDWVVCSVPLDQNNMLCWFLIRSQWPCCVTTSVMWTKTFITVLCQKRLLGHNFIIINLAEEKLWCGQWPTAGFEYPYWFLASAQTNAAT